ncbi:MAG TPA: hypothetical protein VFW15_06755, partial [Thermoanaerobaculia bacterium]|nr:hypothetical protein [Thermoanaerobaculia bacterium]
QEIAAQPIQLLVDGFAEELGARPVPSFAHDLLDLVELLRLGGKYGFLFGAHGGSLGYDTILVNRNGAIVAGAERTGPRLDVPVGREACPIVTLHDASGS